MKLSTITLALVVTLASGLIQAQNVDLVTLKKAEAICVSLEANSDVCGLEKATYQSVVSGASNPPNESDLKLIQNALTIMSVCATRFTGSCTKSVYETFKK